jgi:beta-galactosidase
MRRSSLHEGWECRPRTNLFAEMQGGGAEWVAVTLPHDVMIGTERSAEAGPANAYFPGGSWEYRRTLSRTDDQQGQPVVLDFEGVYRDAVVLVNGVVAARWPYGYSRVAVPIDHLLRPGDNELKVEASAHEDSRWYSGAGIHRDVWLLEAGPVHLSADGLFVRTPTVDDDGAVVTVDAVVVNRTTATTRRLLRVELLDGSGTVVAADVAPVTAFPGAAVPLRRRLFVAEPRRWSLEDPHLHTCRATLLDDEDVVDEDATTFGIRAIAVDAHRGFRLNGEPVLLRGACVHHDNGVLGAAAIGRADERRVERLKAAGFNAIRSAHNPMSRAMLDACDRLGVLVMDETFDMWNQPKSDDDYARRFPDWWERDVEAMVRNARNHPSVVLYSVGNEIPDGSTATGLQVARALAEEVRSLDDSRFVTQAVTGILVGGSELFDELRANMAAPAAADDEAGVNTIATTLGEIMQQLVLSPVVDAKTTEAFAHLDVAGYNYMESRYAVDAELHPERVVVGTETHPPAIADGWAKVLALPSVIGDFTWTGWDYLGEAGIGRTDHSGEGASGAFHGEFPWRFAWCGDIDITGHRRPQSYLREIVFGLRADPYLTVLRAEHQRRPNAHSSPWSYPDVVSSWSWPGHEGEVLEVEVLAAADEVELLLDGTSLGRQPAGADHGFRAAFEVTYQPGELEAVAWTAGEVTGRTSLRSASDEVRLQVEVDGVELAVGSHDLAYVEVTLVDEAGTPHVTADRRIEVTVDGPGVLQGVGSAAPSSDEPFTGAGCTTFDGRALAVVRPTGPGTITATITATGCDPVAVSLDAS